ncbi:hypothetical protein ACCUM_2679 [Candidatus Accumulibacter phosphatis]|uniref:Uncharacterized protein n=1 Tax=Candidatus Accumulibacter phosphatis TaxID=327160 RepID=A0A5S4ER05_9PROT|nr:hypothetical protein ACCUM_2679 [Candidatus Accumulibacter phosphatis]
MGTGIEGAAMSGGRSPGKAKPLTSLPPWQRFHQADIGRQLEPARETV